MAENSQTIPKASDDKGQSALDREAGHVDKLMNSGSVSPKPQSDEDIEKSEKRLRVEQDNRVAQVTAQAKEAGRSDEEPEGGFNPDG